jgi:tRNA pseudouridine65 synthase
MNQAPAPDELPVLFRDEHLVAVHKPAGLLVHRTSLDAHETRFALQILRQKLRCRVFPVHRLDKATSGVLLFALTRETARLLASAFEREEVQKTYVALVRGHLPENGEIDHPLDLSLDDSELRASRRKPVIQPARTAYRRLATVELPHRVDRYPTSRYSLVELCPSTGRRHQLRRHMAHASHHIVGDTTYGKGGHNRLFRNLYGSQRLLLAAVEIRLAHPRSGEGLCLTAPLDGGFLSLLGGLGLAEALPARWRQSSTAEASSPPSFSRERQTAAG